MLMLYDDFNLNESKFKRDLNKGDNVFCTTGFGRVGKFIEYIKVYSCYKCKIRDAKTGVIFTEWPEFTYKMSQKQKERKYKYYRIQLPKSEPSDVEEKKEKRWWDED